MSLHLYSTVFEAGKNIPVRFTCDGANISPPLSWTGVPLEAKSMVLIVDDPDAPDPAAPIRTWVHWVLYNLPVTLSSLPEGITSQNLPDGACEGLNDWHKTGYGGPCPPIGCHRYFHHLYALDVVLPDLKTPDKQQFMAAMQGHVLAKAELIGLYRH